MSLVSPTTSIPLENVVIKNDSGSHTAKTLTYAATASLRWIIHYVIWSFDAAPAAAAAITISDGTSTIAFKVTNGGPGMMPINFVGAFGAVVTVVIADGGSGVTGNINAVASSASS